jgi:DNA polymerase I-like protein with 3'-5' exonuclease and polymerase domains
MIFGASDAKLGMYLTGKRDAKTGRIVREALFNRIKGFEGLINRLKAARRATEESFIPGVDGRKIYTESDHKALNYLLQSCEAITVKGAVALLVERLDEELGPDNWRPLIVYHDEAQFEVKEGLGEKAERIAVECFREGPKLFGVQIMDGDARKGQNWYETH